MGLGVSPCRTCVPNFIQIRARLDTETLCRRSHAVFKMADFLFDIWSRSNWLFCASSCPLSAYQVSVAYAKLFSLAAILQRPFWLRPKRKNGSGRIAMPDVRTQFRPNPCTFRRWNAMPKIPRRFQDGGLPVWHMVTLQETFLCVFMPSICLPSFGCLRQTFQFGGHFAAAILVTAETKKRSGRIAMPDVRANFRPNPLTFRYSNRGD